MIDKSKKPDPFYSESNMAHLRRGIEALNAGKGVECSIDQAILESEQEVERGAEAVNAEIVFEKLEKKHL